jgi:DNA-binding NarL/FixJ family response regulator
MIKVAVITTQARPEVELLMKCEDIKVMEIKPVNIKSIIDQLKLFSPDIFILQDGVENISVHGLCHYLSQHFPNTRSLILTSETPNFEMLQNSGFKARGYVLPDQRDQLAKAVRVVHDGEAWLPRKLVTDMLNRFTASFIMHDEMALASTK